MLNHTWGLLAIMYVSRMYSYAPQKAQCVNNHMSFGAINVFITVNAFVLTNTNNHFNRLTINA